MTLTSKQRVGITFKNNTIIDLHFLRLFCTFPFSVLLTEPRIRLTFLNLN